MEWEQTTEVVNWTCVQVQHARDQNFNQNFSKSDATAQLSAAHYIPRTQTQGWCIPEAAPTLRCIQGTHDTSKTLPPLPNTCWGLTMRNIDYMTSQRVNGQNSCFQDRWLTGWQWMHYVGLIVCIQDICWLQEGGGSKDPMSFWMTDNFSIYLQFIFDMLNFWLP